MITAWSAALDEIALLVGLSVIGIGILAVALRRDDCLDLQFGERVCTYLEFFW